MYKRTEAQMLIPHEFFLPFGGKLNPENRWVKLAALIPWWEIEEKYAKNFKNTNVGQVALSVRVALGSLIIQSRCGFSDEETVEQITENPYLQYFIGLPKFQEKHPFDPSLMTHFRKRLGKDTINEINEMIALSKASPNKDEDKNDDDPSTGSTGKSSGGGISRNKKGNSGKLILDATCAPADIHYPTDLSLLNKAREKLEGIVDTLHEPFIGVNRKPRTYRNIARKNYLSIEKQRRPGMKKIRKAIGKQLRYVRRDLQIIDKLLQKSDIELLNTKQQKELQVIQELYNQQQIMYKNKTHRIEDRIVSIDKPHVRPIVRGKTNAEVEFGAKVAISVVGGYAFMEELSWDNFNEGTTLIKSIENYHQRFGCYPEAVLADKIYRNRDNLRYCKEHGIRLSGPRLGRPCQSELSGQRKLERMDARERNAVEGKFGEGKRTYGLARIMTRLRETSETVISMQLLVMNLEKRLRDSFHRFFKVQILARLRGVTAKLYGKWAIVQ